MLLGSHVSAAGGLANAFVNAAEIGNDAIQIFAKSPRMLRFKPLEDDVVAAWHAARKTSAVKHMLVHANYLVNLATPKSEYAKASREAFLDEMERCHKLSIPLLVFHPGAHQGDGDEKGLSRIVENLNWCLKKGEAFDDVTLCVENTAGQGSNVGYRFEHVKAIVEGVDDPDRMGVCIDTCHTFASGYDLRTPESYAKTMEELDAAVGLSRVKAFHLNDSKSTFASRVDRHENIGKGEIGKKTFSLLVNDKRFAKVPGVVETPCETNAQFKKDVDALRALVGKTPKTQLGDF
ncbi:MAG TPA: deoxyribonuclease IV [Candidatus Thermoplasmatota archaeon]|nr:deoxyribonuclease IV [Candidatus Thermoplasmatota archaeon]